jgi:hypothetical protein
MIEQIYYDPRQPGSFCGLNSLKRHATGTRDLTQFLAKQDAYTIHRPARIRFERRRTYSKGINDLFQTDIVDMSNVATYNNSYRYLLTCIDVFSKYAWAAPLRTKTGREVSLAFEEKILSERTCRMLQSDKGTEYTNSVFQSMLAKHGIHHYTSENDDIKAAVIERWNRTLKERIYRYFTYRNTRRYIDVLNDIVYSYNNTYHRSIGMTPSQVVKENEHIVRARLYPEKPKRFKYRFNIGDTVRMSIRRNVFHKSYSGNWSEEIFTVCSRHPTQPVTYSLKDAADQPIKGRFYECEIQRVTKPVDDFYVVEKILKTRRRAGKIEYYVKWRGYPDSCNSWTDAIRNIE